MDIRKLQRAIVDGLEDVKAQNIAVFNTEHLSPLFERVIVASGTSNRQTKALASSVRESVKKRGMDVLRTEGEENGEWIIVDCGAAVCHVMQPAIREYYRLEEIWGGKTVRLKSVASAGAGLPKASREEREIADEHPSARKVAKGRASVQVAPRDEEAAPRRSAARKAPKPASKGVGKTRGTPGTAAGKAAVKTAAKKTVAPKNGANPTAAATTTRGRAGSSDASSARSSRGEAAPSAARKTASRKAAGALPVQVLKVRTPVARKTSAGKTAGKTASKAAGTPARKTAAAPTPSTRSRKP